MARMGVGRVIESRGDLPGARTEYDKASAGLDRLATQHPDVAKYENSAIEAGFHRADIQNQQGDLAGALANERALLTRAERLVQAAPADTGAIHQVFALRSRIGSALEDQGDLDAALAEYRASLELAKLRADLESVPAADKDLLNAHAHVGRVLDRGKHDIAGALAEYRLGLAIGERQIARDPYDPHWLQDVAISHDETGQILAEKKDLDGALAEYRAGKALAERAAAIDPTNTDLADTVATIGEKVGIALFAQKDYAGAATEFIACDKIWSGLLARDPTNTGWQRGESVIENKLGDVQLAAKDYTAAIASYTHALAVREKLVVKDPTNGSWRRDLMYSHFKLAAAYKAVPDHARRVVELRAAITVANDTLAAHPTNVQYAQDVIQLEGELGNEIRTSGEPGAEDHYRAGLEIAKRMAAHSPAPEWTKLVGELQRAIDNKKVTP